MVALSHVSKACDNVDMVMKLCFGKKLGLMVELITVLETSAVVQDLSVSFVTRSIGAIYMRMRGTLTDAIGKTVDLSVNSEWRNIWKVIRESCLLDRKELTDMRGKGGIGKAEATREKCLRESAHQKGRKCDDDERGEFTTWLAREVGVVKDDTLGAKTSLSGAFVSKHWRSL